MSLVAHAFIIITSLNPGSILLKDKGNLYEKGQILSQLLESRVLIINRLLKSKTCSPKAMMSFIIHHGATLEQPAIGLSYDLFTHFFHNDLLKHVSSIIMQRILTITNS